MPVMPTNSYDELVYRPFFFPQTHPSGLSTVGKLLGLEPAPVETATVLEIGCATGANLMGFAAVLPRARFYGIDLSERQIAIGQEHIASIGYENVQLKAMDLMDLPLEGLQFDYIIAHGLYSWVPEAVSERLLELCRTRLKPDGLAYISYNTYPGWHDRARVRELMCFHTRRFETAREKVDQARAIVQFAKDHVMPGKKAYGASLDREVVFLEDSDDSYIYHELLEAFNRPCLFSEFAKAAGDQGLAYVGDASFHKMFPNHLSPEALKTLSRFSSDNVAFEQYMDFLTNRTFRQSILCHESRLGESGVRGEAIRDMYFSSTVMAIPDLDLAAGVEAVFENDIARFGIAEPLFKASLQLLAEKKGAIAYDELLERSLGMVEEQRHGEISKERWSDPLHRFLLQAAVKGIVGLHDWVPRVADMVPDKPKVPAMTRHYLKAYRMVVNLYHDTLEPPSEELCYLMELCDGSRDHGSLAHEMRRAGYDSELTPLLEALVENALFLV